MHITQPEAGFLQMVCLIWGNLVIPRLTSQLIFWKGMRFCELRSRWGEGWRGKRVLIHIDNSAFQLPFKKGRSKVERLNVLLRGLHLLAVQFDCIFVPVWISTHDDVGADALSRSRFDEFDAWFATACPGVRSRRWRNTRVLGADQAGAEQQA